MSENSRAFGFVEGFLALGGEAVDERSSMGRRGSGRQVVPLIRPHVSSVSCVGGRGGGRNSVVRVFVFGSAGWALDSSRLHTDSIASLLGLYARG